MDLHLTSPAVRVRTRPTGLPLQAGIGLKPMHYADLLDDRADATSRPAFVEVHAENHMADGGPSHAWLRRVREHLPLSLHGVGLSIGGDAPLDTQHLDRLAALVDRYQPAAFSEHLAWSSHGGIFLGDLLPLPYDAGTLARVCEHVDRVQTRLGLRMLLENPSTYLQFDASALSEPEFIRAVVARTGCGLLLDVNNVYVTCVNHGLDADAYIDALPLHAVGEIHLAGHAHAAGADGETLLIDDHGGPVAAPVWSLYAGLVARTGPLPTLIEWDNDVPAYAVLREQAQQAGRAMDAAACVRTARHG